MRTGTVVFVGAGVEHRFHSIEEDLTVLIFFAPAEYARATDGQTIGEEARGCRRDLKEEVVMAHVENGGFTARMDEPFVTFVIGI